MQWGSWVHSVDPIRAKLHPWMFCQWMRACLTVHKAIPYAVGGREFHSMCITLGFVMMRFPDTNLTDHFRTGPSSDRYGADAVPKKDRGNTRTPCLDRKHAKNVGYIMDLCFTFYSSTNTERFACVNVGLAAADFHLD